MSSFPGILNDLLTSSEVSSVNSFQFSKSFVFHLTLCGIIMQIISIYTSVLTVCISTKHFFQFVYNSTTKYQLHVVGWAGVAATVHKMTDHRTKVRCSLQQTITTNTPDTSIPSKQQFREDGGGLLHHAHSEFVKKTFPNALN